MKFGDVLNFDTSYSLVLMPWIDANANCQYTISNIESKSWLTSMTTDGESMVNVEMEFTDDSLIGAVDTAQFTVTNSGGFSLDYTLTVNLVCNLIFVEPFLFGHTVIEYDVREALAIPHNSESIAPSSCSSSYTYTVDPVNIGTITLAHDAFRSTIVVTGTDLTMAGRLFTVSLTVEQDDPSVSAPASDTQSFELSIVDKCADTVPIFKPALINMELRVGGSL